MAPLHFQRVANLLLIPGNLDHPKNLGHYIFGQNNFREIWATVDLSLVVIKGNLGHYYSALSVPSGNMGHRQPIKIVIITKCPKLPRIYSAPIIYELILENMCRPAITGLKI